MFPGVPGQQLPDGAPRGAVEAEFSEQLTVEGLQPLTLLAVAAMVILSVYLRQPGSPESKPVGAAHTATGVEG